MPDGITPYVCDSKLKSVLETLEHNSELAVAWFELNYMKLNTDKCHLLVSGNKIGQMSAKLDRTIVWKSNDIKLLGIKLNNKLKFDKHVSIIYSKANRKLSTLTRVAKFLTFKKKLILVKAFTESQFKHYSLVWMFHGRQINDNINKLHERDLRIVYNDTIMSFEEFLVEDETFTIDHQNSQLLAIEMHKAVNNLPGGNFSEFFVRNNLNCNLRSKSKLTVPSINNVFKGQNFISYFGSVIWNSISAELREINSF